MVNKPAYTLPVLLALLGPMLSAAHADGTGARQAAAKKLDVAAVVTTYYHNSHADIIASRLLQTYTLDGQGEESPLALASLYTDQKADRDISRRLAASHRFPIHESIERTLTLDTGELAVDGVLLIAEHGDYPESETGNTQYPKRRFFDETVAVFEASDRVVPVFMDKHVADNWADIEHIHQTAQAMDIPMMAGSSLPVTWRRPAADVERGAELEQIVALSFHTLDGYAFHALEFVQALAEQRAGGETGIEAVQTRTGQAVWDAMDSGFVDPALFDEAWERLPRHLNGDRPLEEAVDEPVLFTWWYADGLVAHVLTLNGAVAEWSGAWRYGETGEIESAQFWTQEGRPGMHFTHLLHGIERMMLTGEPAWPVERTVLTSGALDALLRSKMKGDVRIETPHLDAIEYESNWRWQQPPPPPPTRPWAEQ